jgi:hypothetical protein
MGAASARHSPCPLFQRAVLRHRSDATSAPREDEAMSAMTTLDADPNMCATPVQATCSRRADRQHTTVVIRFVVPDSIRQAPEMVRHVCRRQSAVRPRAAALGTMLHINRTGLCFASPASRNGLMAARGFSIVLRCEQDSQSGPCAKGSSAGADGGHDRDRTCDPYHVKVVLSR